MIDVPPLTREVLTFIRILLVVLEALEFPSFSISSWYRTPEKNAAVGGVPNSLHLRGLAMDLVGPRSSLERIYRIWTLVGLDAVEEGDHLHIELDGMLARQLGIK